MKWNIGNFEGESIRRRPNRIRWENYLKSMSNDFKDHDVYLWGSFPNRDTWDIDILLHNDGTINTELMEDISIKSLNNSLIKNEFLVDLGFTNKPVKQFQDYVNHYNNTGKRQYNTGYVYGDKWYADGEVFRDRTQWRNGSIRNLDNNILKYTSPQPYDKMIKSINDGTFKNIYGHKPLLIKERNRIYG